MDKVFTGKSYRIANKTIDLDYLPESPFNKNNLCDGSTMTCGCYNEASVKEYIAKIFTIEDFDQDFDYDDSERFANGLLTSISLCIFEEM